MDLKIRDFPIYLCMQHIKRSAWNHWTSRKICFAQNSKTNYNYFVKTSLDNPLAERVYDQWFQINRLLCCMLKSDHTFDWMDCVIIWFLKSNLPLSRFCLISRTGLFFFHLAWRLTPPQGRLFTLHCIIWTLNTLYYTGCTLYRLPVTKYMINYVGSDKKYFCFN